MPIFDELSPATPSITPIEVQVTALAHAGRAAQRVLALMDDAGKAAALRSAAAALRQSQSGILAANGPLDGMAVSQQTSRHHSQSGNRPAFFGGPLALWSMSAMAPRRIDGRCRSVSGWHGHAICHCRTNKSSGVGL